jgi:outer membrane autotransporter protein
MKTQLKVVALSVLVATSVHAKESEDMYFGLGAVQTKFGGDEGTVRGITFSEEAYKKNNYKVTFGKRLNKNFAVEGSYTNYSSDEITSSMSAANGTALEAAIVALPEGAAKKSLIGLTGVTLTGTGTTNAKITSSAAVSGRSIGLSGLYYFAPSDSFEPFVKLGVSAWNMKAESSAFQYDNAGILTEIAGATDFSNKVSDTNVVYGVGVDGKINDTIKYRVDFERTKVDDSNIDNIGIGMLYSF